MELGYQGGKVLQKICNSLKFDAVICKVLQPISLISGLFLYNLKSARATGPDTLPLTRSCWYRSAERVGTPQHDTGVTHPAGRPHLIKIFENTDREIAAEPRMVLEGRGGKGALGRAFVDLAG